MRRSLCLLILFGIVVCLEVGVAVEAGADAKEAAAKEIADEVGEEAAEKAAEEEVAEKASEGAAQKAAENEVAADAAAGAKEKTAQNEVVDEAVSGASEKAEQNEEGNFISSPENELLSGFTISCLSCTTLEDVAYTYLYDYSSYEGGAEDVIAYRKGQDTGLWNACDNPNLTPDDCYVDDIYTDEIQFEILYGFTTALDYDEIEVKVQSGSSAKPEIYELIPDEEEFVVKITIVYNCTPAQSEVNVMEMSFPLEDGERNAIKWIKVCGQGENEKIKVGYITHDKLELEMALPSGVMSNLVVEGDDPSTTIFMKPFYPARAQKHGKPVVTTDEKIVTATIRGPAALPNTLYPQFAVNFDVNYECKTGGTSDVELNIPIPPFDDIVRKWKKECPAKDEYPIVFAPGSGYEDVESESTDAQSDDKSKVELRQLSIGTTYQAQDVMVAGVPTEEYSIKFDGGLEYADHHMRFEKNVTDLTFYILNPIESTTSHKIDHIAFTVSDSRILSARVVTPAIQYKSYLAPTGGAIGPGDTAKLSIHFVCKDDGIASMLVTLADLYSGNVEFGFVKECRKPVKVKESGMLRTARSLLNVILFFFVVVTGVSVYYYRKRKASRVDYAPVAPVARP